MELFGLLSALIEEPDELFNERPVRRLEQLKGIRRHNGGSLLRSITTGTDNGDGGLRVGVVSLGRVVALFE